MLKDFLGNPITPGDWIVWPGRQSSSIWLNYGEVLEAHDEPQPNYSGAFAWQYDRWYLKVRTSKGRLTYVKYLDKVVVVTRLLVP